MANRRLRDAITRAGLDADQLATLVEVDVKTVHRWLAGNSLPYSRHRVRVARALEKSEQELWPEVAIKPTAEDARWEIIAAYPHTNDLRAPDWRTLMRDATEQIDLLSYTLIDILATPGTTDLLAAKAVAGCAVRVLIAAPESMFVSSAATQLRQDDEDYVSRSELQREIELARGHLEPLLNQPGVEGRSFYAERYNTILRFDDQMLVILHLWGTRHAQAPALHLRRRIDDGLFDQFAGHLEAVIEQASEPIEPNPEHYPDPSQHPDRYRPVTQDLYEQQTRAIRQESQRELASPRLPLEQVRQQLREQPQDPT